MKERSSNGFIFDEVLTAIRPLLEHSLIGVFILQDENICYANQYVAEFSGYSLEEIRRSHIKRMIHPDDWQGVVEIIPERLAGKVSADPRHLRIVKKDGTIGHVQIISGPALHKGKPALLGMFFDITTAKVLERELKDHQIGLQTFLNSSPDAVLSFTKDGYCIFANLSAAQKFATTPDQMMGEACNIIFSGKQAEVLMMLAGQAMEARTTIEHETAFTFPIGSRFVHIRMFPLLDESGRADAVMAIIRDDTKRREAEEALRRSEESFRLLVEETPDYGIVGLDVEGNILSWNQGAERIFGYKAHEMLNKHFETLFMDEHKVQNKPQEELEKAKKHGNWRYEAERRRKDGKKIFVMVSTAPLRDKEGKLVGFSRIIRDITENKHIKEIMERRLLAEATISAVSSHFALAEEKDYESKINYALSQLENLLGVNKIGVFLHENDLYATNAFHHWGGSSVSSIFGHCRTKHCLDTLWMNEQFSKKEFVAMRSIRCLKKMIPDSHKSLESRKVKSIMALPLRFQGILIGNLCACSTVNPLKWHKEYIVAIKTIGENIAAAIMHQATEKEREKLEQQLAQAQKMEAIGNLAGGIAHDFNNLLTPIIGYLSLMKSEIDESHPFYHYVETMEASSSRAADIVRQLLGFARRGKFQASKISINELIKKSVMLMRETFPRNISLDTELADNLWNTTGDATQIEQILLNLCINAQEALTEGGNIKISTSNQIMDKASMIEHPYIKAGEYTLIEVQDNGQGIPEKIRQRVFEPFFTTKSKGTGLGLATVYGITKNHGGFVHLYCEPGKGTSFKVYLPAVDLPVSEGKPKAAVSTNLDGQECVLILDDEPAVLETTKNMLEHRGYEVICSNNGLDAIEILKSKADISLVVLDYVMPDLAGLELYQELRQVAPEVKVLVSSGYSLNEQIQELLDKGADGFVQKPYAADTLCHNIRALLG